MNEGITPARIRQLRQTAGLTQMELAVALDVSIGAVAKWEQGRGVPGSGMLPRLIRALDTDYNGLYERPTNGDRA